MLHSFLCWLGHEEVSDQLSTWQKVRLLGHLARLKANKLWYDAKDWWRSWWKKPKGEGETYHAMPPEEARPKKWKEHFEIFYGWTDPQVIAGGGDGIIVAFKQPFVMKVPHLTPLAWQIFSELQEQQQSLA